MGHAILQTDQSPIAAEQLAKAFMSIDRYAPADGVKMARDSFGLIIDHLRAEEADRLSRALGKVGVDTRVVSDDVLFTMPPVKTTKRFDCLADHLLVYDALGRPITLSWDQVLVVAAGQVSLYEPKIIEVDRNAHSARGTDLPVTVTDRSIRGEEVPRLVLDLIVLGEPARYRCEAQEMNYAYLADRQAGSVEGNFAVVLADMVSFASAATLNQGAVALLSDFENAFTYPSRKSFEREIVWLITSATLRQ
ncbi:MAG: hypothetical protein WD768_00540 [Phycisphaeraceae bacterium]